MSGDIKEDTRCCAYFSHKILAYQVIVHHWIQSHFNQILKCNQMMKVNLGLTFGQYPVTFVILCVYWQILSVSLSRATYLSVLNQKLQACALHTSLRITITPAQKLVRASSTEDAKEIKTASPPNKNACLNVEDSNLVSISPWIYLGSEGTN